MTNVEQANLNEVVSLTEEDKYYQILIVEPRPGKTEPKNINVTLFTKTKKEFQQQFPLKIKEESQGQSQESIGKYLPSNGLVLAEGLVKEIFANQEQDDLQINPVSKLNNFYITARSLYITRKVSQLLAKSWYAYLKAKKPDNPASETPTPWENFVAGNWKQIDSEILDGLIIREILLFDNQYSPDIYDPIPEGELLIKLYKHHSNTVILPTNKALQGICLSLLLGGQVYYEMDQDDKSIYEYEKRLTQAQIKQKKDEATSKRKYYRQVSQPILSTFEMVRRYVTEVDWSSFRGDIQELQINPHQSNSLYKAIIPYPPIPSERSLAIEDIKKWADAEDDLVDDPQSDSILPFYDRTEQGKYNLNVKYVSPPFPYLPLSTT